MSATVSDNMASVWVFAYGSLTWKPGIEYNNKYYGYIKGFKRRFWQGNATHRGTPERPGRVATLVPDCTSVLWGVAYELKGREQIRQGFEHLTKREMKLGGYTTYTLEFYRRDSADEPIPTIAYTATPENDLYLGSHHTVYQMALHIATSQGQAGPNSEYVTKLADFYRTHIPEEKDEHLFLLDETLRKLLATRRTLIKHHQRKEVEKQNISKRSRTGKTQRVTKVEMETTEHPFCTASRDSNGEEKACTSSLLTTRAETKRDE